MIRLIIPFTRTFFAFRVAATTGLAVFLSGCPTAPVPPISTNPCDQSGVICTVAGTGRSLFDGDGRPALRTSFYFPVDVDFDSEGRALILDENNFRVRRINTDTSVQTIMGLGEEGSPTDGALAVDTLLHHASDLGMDSAGRMYVGGNHEPIVFRIDLDDRVDVLAGNGQFGNDGDGGPAKSAKLSAPYGVLPLDDGSFYFSDIDAHVIRFVDASGTIHTAAGDGTRGYSGDGGPGNQARLNGPTRLSRDADGSIYFCDTNNHVIRRLATDGVITTFAGTGEPGYSGDGGPATAATFRAPHDLRFSPRGDLFVADTENHVIRRIDRDGVVTTVVGSGLAGFEGDEGQAGVCRLNGPGGVNFDEHGHAWIADTLNQRVRRVAGFLGVFDRNE